MKEERDWDTAGKLAVAALVHIGLMIVGFVLIGGVVPQTPWEILLAVYLVGVVAAHIWTFTGMVSVRSYTDLRPYREAE